MKIKNQILQIILIMTLAITTFSCESDEKPVVKLQTIEEIAKADPANFSILLAALNKTALINTTRNPGSYTVFAPTNAAFLATTTYTEANINALSTTVPADVIVIARLRSILQNHIIGVGTLAKDLPIDGYFKSFSPYGTSTTATISNYMNQSASGAIINGGLTNGGAKVITADINASNGVVHVVDGVIAIPTIVSHVKANLAFSKLLEYVTGPGGTFGIPSVLTNLNGATATASLTVFAPTNASFTAAFATGGFANTATTAQISTLLRYHIWAGNRLRSNMTEGLVVNTTTSPVQTFKILIAPIASVTGLRIEDKGIAPNNISKLSIVPTYTDIQASNGVIHQVEKVLQPVL